MLEALLRVFTERRRMLAALYALGHDRAYEIEPRNIDEQIASFTVGDTCIGTQDDPFIIMSEKDELIARWYIEADEEGCSVRMSGSAEFMATMEKLAGDTVH